MKKKIIILPIFFLICLFFYINSNNVFAAKKCPEATKGDWQEDCVCDTNDLPYGGCDDLGGQRDWLCNTAETPAVCRLEKRPRDECNPDGKCNPNEFGDYGGLLCINNKCTEASKVPKAMPGGACSQDSDCAQKIYGEQNQYCNYLQKQEGNKGTCTLEYTSRQGDACVHAKACGKGTTCYEGTCLFVSTKTGRGGQVPGGPCQKTFECRDEYFCQNKVCVLTKTNGEKCSLDEECLEGKCDEKTKTCTTGKQEGAICSKEDQKCAPGHICEIPEGGSTGTCKKEILLTLEAKDEIAKKTNNLDADFKNRINAYCSRGAKTGLFTKGVSNACWNCGNCQAKDIYIVIANVVNGIMQITGLLAAFAVIVSGFMYIISRGKEEQTQKAKAGLTAAITGLVIIFTAYILINAIMSVLGYNCGNWFNPNFIC